LKQTNVESRNFSLDFLKILSYFKGERGLLKEDVLICLFFEALILIVEEPLRRWVTSSFKNSTGGGK